MIAAAIAALVPLVAGVPGVDLGVDLGIGLDLGLGAGRAFAEPSRPIDLRLDDPITPSPVSLKMRVAAAPQSDGAPTSATPGTTSGKTTDATDASDATAGDANAGAGDAAVASLDAPVRATTGIGDVYLRRDLSEGVIFRFNLGLGLDGGEPSGNRLLSGASFPFERSGERFAPLRSYYFGDVVLGSRGLVVPALSTYLAAQYRFDQAFQVDGQTPASNAVPSLHDGDDVGDILIRSAYAEADGLFESRLLAPLYIRAGRQFRYGAAVAHFDGVTIGYDTPVVSVGAFIGTRVDLYGFDFDSGGGNDGDGAITGANWRLDLFELRRAPVVISGSWLEFDGHTHLDGALALRWSRDILIRGGVRLLDGAAARESLTLNARISRVTTISVEVESRERDDWVYDLLLVSPATADADPRSYLNLGPTLPRAYVSFRAGTVLLDNIDVLIRGGLAAERARDDEPVPTFASNFVEAGGAVEIRLRRTLALGTSFLARAYDRESLSEAEAPPAFPELAQRSGILGETTFVEAGTTLRFSSGARKFNASVEAYGRYYAELSPYVDPDDDGFDIRGGGRFTVEGWAGDSLRLKGEYDLSTTLALAPELRGVKSLRVLMEALF